MLNAVPLRTRPLIALPFALLLAGLAGCETAPKEHALEVAADTQPVSLAADGGFFANTLKASLTLKRGRPGEAMPMGARPPREYAPMLQPHAIGTTLPGAANDRGGSMQVDAPGPALTLRLRLENRGLASLEVHIIELNSALGNFAVRPERLTLAPGESGEVDPMISQLGVIAERVPVKLILRVAGTTEEQTLILGKPAPAP